nr:hypothetical protein CFP56_30663 [Quercus suber]
MSEKPLSMGNTPLAPPVPSRPSTAIRPQARRPHDPAVMFEEYHYYALRTRAEEESLPTPKTDWREIVLRKKPEAQQQREEQNPDGDSDEYSSTVRTFPAADLSNEEKRLEISDREWTDASRAFRSASWGACFYLITTDILGPYVSALSVLILPSDKAPNVDGTQGVGFALGTLGWGPGIALYTVFGFMAGYSGYLIWHMFLGLDSHEFPARNYGDIAFRIYGNTARYVLNSLQALALILILGQVTIQNGQAISQVSKFRLCYAVCPVLFICAGFLLGQIRTLRSYGWVANFAVWLNLLVIFITMGVMAHSPPNFQISTLGSAGSAVAPDTITPDANGVYPPVRHYGGLPDPSSLVGSLNGLLSGVLAYSGAQLFVEFMAEMRRPRDFLKAMWGAQFFIYAVYLIYGCYVYFWQGQYAYQVSYQGVSSYGWQTAGNMLALISGLIAAGLYSNIGIKVLYNNVLIDIFNAPPLTTRGGKILWAIIVPLWWIVAFIIAAAIPDYFGFVSVMSAATLMHLVYSFPPLLTIGYDIRLANLHSSPDAAFDPHTGVVRRARHGLQYWVRGFLAGSPLQVAMNVLHLMYALGALAMAGLGLYAAIEGMIDAFKNPQLNSFSCRSPLDLSG